MLEGFAGFGTAPTRAGTRTPTVFTTWPESKNGKCPTEVGSQGNEHLLDTLSPCCFRLPSHDPGGPSALCRGRGFVVVWWVRWWVGSGSIVANRRARKGPAPAPLFNVGCGRGRIFFPRLHEHYEPTLRSNIEKGGGGRAPVSFGVACQVSVHMCPLSTCHSAPSRAHDIAQELVPRLFLRHGRNRKMENAQRKSEVRVTNIS